MKREDLLLLCCSDVAGKVRGKAFPAGELDNRLRRGVGWTPTNVQITCFDAIADSPFGALGDLVLIPDPDTEVNVDFGDGRSAERFILGDIRNTDGSPWSCCTRSILRAALGRLERVAGLTLLGAFEHEFQFAALADARPLGAYSAAGMRAARDFAGTLTVAMRDAGLTPDTFMKEYGEDQYEVTLTPRHGVAAADQAVVLREITRATGERYGRPLSFTPLRDPAGVGNGVHVHMSFLDGDGKPALYDPDGVHGLSELGGRFAAGVLKYLDRTVALTAPSAVSYTRLTPHRWSAAFNNLGFRDREAALRICPVSSLSDVDAARQFNIEFRASDAAASPYLQLAAIVHAGVQGVEEELPCPDPTGEDLSLLSPEALAGRGLIRLPQTLDEALRRFAASATVRGWFGDEFCDVYLRHKRGELAYLSGKSLVDICAAYAAAY